jgi:hypothetical protein
MLEGHDMQKKKRQVLVILSNRLNRLQKPRFIEVECDDKGNIFSERRLRAEPRAPRYDEVWENDEGKTDFAACHRFSRKYRHKLEQRAARRTNGPR